MAQRIGYLAEEGGYVPFRISVVYQSPRKQENILLGAAYDDCIPASPSLAEVEGIKKACALIFKVEEKGIITSFCGIRIKYNRDAGKLSLRQQPYIQKIIDEHLNMRSQSLKRLCKRSSQILKFLP